MEKEILSVETPISQVVKLREIAEREDRSLSWVLRKAITLYLDTVSKSKKTK